VGQPVAADRTGPGVVAQPWSPLLLDWTNSLFHGPQDPHGALVL
jgi:hypothetical protein